MKNKWPYIILSILAALILLMGGWWVSLLLRLGKTLSHLNIGNETDYAKLVKMLSWEGIFFVMLILFFCAGLFWLFWQDRKKQKSMQQFFASITHELKTPLASVSMQSEFISELMNETQDFNPTQRQQLSKLTKRLIDDSKNLELQFDKAMQLSRIERGGVLSLSKIELKNFILREINKCKLMNFQLNISDDIQIMADEFALQTIFRNLIDNTNKHRVDIEKVIQISCEQRDHFVQITYNDHGEAFSGDLKQLGNLFYKFNSSNGTGIGLYIIKRLTTGMSGQLLIEQQPHLIFKIKLPIAARGAADE